MNRKTITSIAAAIAASFVSTAFAQPLHRPCLHSRIAVARPVVPILPTYAYAPVAVIPAPPVALVEPRALLVVNVPQAVSLPSATNQLRYSSPSPSDMVLASTSGAKPNTITEGSNSPPTVVETLPQTTATTDSPVVVAPVVVSSTSVVAIPVVVQSTRRPLLSRRATVPTIVPIAVPLR
jgi:hypothetical protein